MPLKTDEEVRAKFVSPEEWVELRLSFPTFTASTDRIESSNQLEHHQYTLLVHGDDFRSTQAQKSVFSDLAALRSVCYRGPSIQNA